MAARTSHAWVPWIQWKNFRGFRDTGRVELKPLTVILGPNSSGKSSLYKPILLMQQTIASRGGLPGLITRGPHANAGGYEDLVPLGNSQTPIGMTLGFHTHPRSRGIDAAGMYPPGVLKLLFQKGDSPDEVSLSAYEIEDIFERRMLRRERRRDGRYSLQSFVDSSREPPAGAFDASVRKALRELEPSHFLFSGARAFSRANRPKDSESPTQSSNGDDSGVELSEYTVGCLRALDYIDDHVRSLLNTFRYLGPLREAPRRVYELSGEAPMGVGMRGESAPEVLFRGRGSELERDVTQSLREFGFVDDLRAHEVGPGLFMLGLTRQGWNRPINIADLGFGVSQVLPIVVQGLMLQRDDYLLAEQPEIHLNPKLQARLADFFARIVARDGRVIVETHSEHLLLSIRRCVAEEKIDASAVAIYFVEMVEGESRLRQIPLDDLGHIPSDQWPRGFFEDGLGEAMALSAAQSQKVRSRAE